MPNFLKKYGMYDSVVYINPLQNIKSQSIKVLDIPHFTSNTTLDSTH